MKLSEQTGEIFKSLNKFRGQLVQPAKDAKNPFFKSNYVTLDGVIKSIDDALKGTGLSYFQEATGEDNQVSVATVIVHESGQYIELSPLVLPTTKRDPQAYGSAITYAKRYALAAAFGVGADKDDDANRAVEKVSKEQRKTIVQNSQTPKHQTDKEHVIKEIKQTILQMAQINGIADRDKQKEFYLDTLGEIGIADISELSLANERKLLAQMHKKLSEQKKDEKNLFEHPASEPEDDIPPFEG